MTTDSVRISVYRKGGTARVKLPYSPDRVVQIRKVEGRRWNPKTKCWEVPDRPNLEALLWKLFPDDRVELVDGEPEAVRDESDPDRVECLCGPYQMLATAPWLAMGGSET